MQVLATATTSETSAEVTVDPLDQVTTSLDSMLEGFFEAVPGLGMGLVVLLLFVVVARLTRGPIERRLAKAKTRSFGRVFGSLIYAGIIILGLFFAIPLAIPSIELAAMLGGLGLLGVAAGFAFGDILSNMLSGILLLVRDPFRSGDQIEVNDIAGTVQLITIRETQILTFDGRLVYVPNKDVYSNAIEVQTGQRYIRSSLIVGVDYDTDLAHARATALEVLDRIEDVRDEPEPEAYYVEFGASSINLDLRYWTSSRQADIRRVQDQVVEGIKAAFDAEGIGIPFDIVTLDASINLERTLEKVAQKPASRGPGQGANDGGAAGDNGSAGARVPVGNGSSRGRAPESLDQLTREELYERAQKAGIEGRSQMNKRQLLSALRER